VATDRGCSDDGSRVQFPTVHTRNEPRIHYNSYGLSIKNNIGMEYLNYTA